MKTILLIDFSALFRSAWHANSNGPISVAFDATIGGVGRAERMTEDCIVAICCDGKGNWRKALSKEYKAQREAQPENMYEEIRRTEERLRREGRTVWRVDGYEADDLIATACFKARELGHPVRIASHDKDMLQLLGVGIDYVNTRKWKVITDRDVLERYGVKATQFADYLSLCGDTNDGIKGAKGIGPVRAEMLLTKYGNLDGIYAALSSAEDSREIGSPGVSKSLDMYRDTVQLARKLVSLKTDAPIAFDDLFRCSTKEGSPSAAVVSGGSREQPQAETKGSVPDGYDRTEAHGKLDTVAGIQVK